MISSNQLSLNLVISFKSYMTYCSQCRKLVDPKEDTRCKACGLSLAASGAILSADELSKNVRSATKRGNKWLFILGGSLLSVIPCVLFSAPIERYVIGIALGFASCFILHYRFHTYFGAMIVYALPQILFSGVNFFAWLGFLCIGYAIGIWKMSLRDMQ